MIPQRENNAPKECDLINTFECVDNMWADVS